MFALLGEIQFKLITHFDGIEINKATKYARHEVLDGKPILQRTGDELDEVTIELAFHEEYCDPAAEMKKLDDARLSGAALPLIWGNGALEGQFVIEKLSIKTQTADRFGTVSALSASVSLTEYVEQQPIVAARSRQKQQAPARKKKGKASAKKATGTKVVKPATGTTTVRNKDGVEFTKITRN